MSSYLRVLITDISSDSVFSKGTFPEVSVSPFRPYRHKFLKLRDDDSAGTISHES